MRKNLLVLSFLFVLFIGNFSTAFAQTAYNNDVSSYLPQTDSNVPHNLTTLTHGIIVSAISTGYCILIGSDPLNPTRQCLGVNTSTGKLSYAQPQHIGGALGLLTSAISMTFNIPIHSGSYIHYLTQ